MESATHPQGLRTINACIEKNNIDTVFFEHFWLTGYAFKIGAHIKKVIVYHDLHHSIFKQMVRIERRLHRKFFSFLLFVKFYIFEKLLENKATLKIFLNPVEMASLPNNSVHIPHIVNPDIRFIPIRETKSFNLLFIGTYNHPPNRRSVQFIFENILPLLATVRFDFKIHVVGPDTEKFSHLINGSPYENHVIIHGFKQDINEAFREMDIALFPILDGGGIKTKLIDAMAAGVPVVTTPKGVEGLQGLPEGCMGIGASPEEIIEEINRLMSSYLLRVQRSLKGKSFIDREHSFSAFSQKVAQVFSRL